MKGTRKEEIFNHKDILVISSKGSLKKQSWPTFLAIKGELRHLVGTRKKRWEEKRRRGGKKFASQQGEFLDPFLEILQVLEHLIHAQGQTLVST